MNASTGNPESRRRYDHVDRKEGVKSMGRYHAYRKPMTSYDVDDRKEDVKPLTSHDVDRKEDVKQLTSYDVDRKEDVKPVTWYGSSCNSRDGFAGQKKSKMDDHWVWQPHLQAQSLQHLLAKGVGTVSGHLQCSRCKVDQYLQFDLVAAFHELRDGLVAHREMIRGPEFGLGAHRVEIQAVEFASTSCAKLVCPSCGKRSMSPVTSQLERLQTEIESEFNLRKVENMNMLFLLLGKFMRFCTADELHAIWLYLGFPPKRIPSAILPHGMAPKQSYLIALHYRLARILDPNNLILDIGPWPFRSME